MTSLEKMDSKETSVAYVTERRASGEAHPDDNYDAVFGEQKAGDVNYKSVGWYVQICGTLANFGLGYAGFKLLSSCLRRSLP